MNNLIISQNQHWENKYNSLFERDALDKLVKSLEVGHIQVLQGIRRSGKSSLFKLIINHLLDFVDAYEILYLNLDDPFFIKYANNPNVFKQIIQTAKKLTQKDIKYIFLDEIQAIKGWERYVKSAYDNQEFKKIFVTGSNSSLLNGEFATLLTGRYLSMQIYPLSFQEILMINKIDSFLKLNKQLPKVLKIIDEMMKYGSFAEVKDIKEEFRRDLLSSYYDTILLKDCVSNSQIRDIAGFKELSFYALSNLTSLYSYTSLSKAVKLNDKSVKDYICSLQECYLFSEIKLFSYSLKEQANNKKKLYLCDNGFMNLGYTFSTNYGKLFENLVFSELQKRGYEIYFYNKNSECDFLVKKDDKLIAIQVCYELDEQNKTREISGLEKLPFEVSSKYIITYNQKESLKDIEVVSFWEYFFD